MSVRVVKDPGTTTGNRDYVRVSTSPDPNDDTVTLATIQRIVEKLNLERASASKLHVKTLIMQQPMTPDAALGLATCYAERKQIPVVVAETD
jgi:hypothetical protein